MWVRLGGTDNVRCIVTSLVCMSIVHYVTSNQWEHTSEQEQEHEGPYLGFQGFETEGEEQVPAPVPGPEMRNERNHGRKLVATTVLGEPYMMLKERGRFLAGNERFEGFMADVLAHLASTLGFNYEIRLVGDGTYGRMEPGGNWTGCMGTLTRGEADIVAAPLTITPERARVVDFTRSFLKLRSTALVKKPRKRRRSRLRTAEDLLRSDLKYGVIEGSTTHDFFKESTHLVYRSMWARMLNFWPSPFSHSLQEGLHKARAENYAFIVDVPIAEYVANGKPCDLYTIEPFLPIREYAFALRKGDELTASISLEMERLEDSGELQTMYIRWWKGECHRRKPKPTTNPVANSEDTSTQFSPWRYATASLLSSGTNNRPFAAVFWMTLVSSSMSMVLGAMFS